MRLSLRDITTTAQSWRSYRSQCEWPVRAKLSGTRLFDVTLGLICLSLAETTPLPDWTQTAVLFTGLTMRRNLSPTTPKRLELDHSLFRSFSIFRMRSDMKSFPRSHQVYLRSHCQA